MTKYAYDYALEPGGIGLEAMNENIRNFFASNPTEEATRAAMAEFAVRDEDILRATGRSFSDYFPTVGDNMGAPAGGVPGVGPLGSLASGTSTASTNGALPASGFDAFGNPRGDTWTEDRYNPNDPASKSYLADPNAGQYVLDQVTGKPALVSSTSVTPSGGALSAATNTANRFYDPNLKQEWVIESASDYGYGANRFAGSDGKVYINPVTGQALTRDEYLSTAGTPEALEFQEEQADRMTLGSQINELTKSGTTGGTWNKNQGYYLHQQNITDYLVDQDVSDLSNVTWKRNPDSTITIYDKTTNRELGTADINSPYIEIGREGTGKGKTHYFMVPTKEGGVTFASQWEPTSDPTLKAIAKAGPIVNIANFLTGGALTPLAMTVNAINAAENRDALGFATSMAGAAGLNDLATAGRVAQMAKSGNVLGALATVAGSELGGQIGNVDLGGGFTVTDAMSAASAIDRVSKGDYAGALTMAGKAAGSADLQTAGSALNFAKAIESGDPSRIANAAMQLQTNLNTSINNSQVANLLINSAGIGAIDADAGTAATGIIRTDPLITAGSESLDAKQNVGASAFAAAKAAGADDATAFETAKAATVGTIIPAAATSRDTTYDPDLVDATAGQALATRIANAQEAVRMGAGEATGTGEIKAGAGEFAGAGASQTVSEKISNAPNFGAAYAAAREAFGPNATFNYQGKLYSTATFQEDPKLGLKPVEGSGRGTASGKTAEQETALINTANALAAAQSAKPVESTGFFQNLSNALSNQMKLSSDAANAYLQNNPNSPITQSVSTALEAAGELQKNVIGGTALMLDKKPVADAFIKGGNELIKLGQSIGTGPQDTKNWNDTLQLIDQATGFEKLGVLAGRVLDGTSGLGRQTVVEIRQELPALFLGGGTARGVLVASGLVDTKDTAGGAAIDAYDDAIKTGKNHNDALADARKAGLAAGAAEAAVQLTLGKLGDLALGKLDNVVSKGVGRVGAEGVTEGGQEGFSSLAQDVALGRDANINNALTQAVAGLAVGKSTTAATSPVSGIQDATELREAAVDAQGVSNAVNNLQSLYGSDKASTIVQTLTSASDLNAAGQSIAKDLSSIMGDDAAVKTANTLVSNFAVNNAADTMATQGLNVNNLSTVVGNTDTGGTITLGDALGAAITGNGVGVDTSTVVGTKSDGSSLTLGELSGVVKGGGTSVTAGTGVDTKTGPTVTAGTGPTVTAGTDTTTKAGVSTATDTTAQAGVATDTKSGVTTDTTTDTNTDTTTQTTTDTNTNTTTQTATNATTNVTTQVTTNNNTGATTTVTSDPTLGTTSQTTTTTTGTSTTTVDASSQVTTNVTVDTTTGLSTETVCRLPERPESEVVITVTNQTTGEIVSTETKTVAELTPEEKEKLVVTEPEPVTKTTEKKPTTKKPAAKAPTGGGMLLGQGPQATSKIEMPEEVWLGGRFRTDLPSIAALFPFLFPSQEQQDTAAVSALRRASGVEPQVPKKEDMDYYAYGKEPSIDSVLEPYLNGGSVQKYAQGGIIMPSALQAAAGGTPHKGSHYVQGAGGGQDDLIPARLADGEYVFDAEIVAALGDGSNKEGARRLDAMREAIRKHKRSGSLKKIPPPAKNPLAYFKEANK